MGISYVYDVFSVDPTRFEAEREVDGETVTVVRNLVSVQLTSPDHGTINLRVAQSPDSPFVAGGRVTVSFEEVTK